MMGFNSFIQSGINANDIDVQADYKKPNRWAQYSGMYQNSLAVQDQSTGGMSPMMMILLGVGAYILYKAVK